MEPRVLRVERVFPNSFLQGRDYSWFESLFNNLVEEIRSRIVGCFMDGQARFVMNREMYRLFYLVAPMIKGPYWNGIRIEEDLTPECLPLPWNNDEKPKGRILLEYREPVYIPFELMERRNTMPLKDGNTATFYFDEFIGLNHGHGFQKVPHIDHVKFNGPATIVFWKDGTKTVVKYDGEGFKDYRKAILYAFIRKIYGEGRPYHDILNEIENVMEQELWMPLPEKEDRV